MQRKMQTIKKKNVLSGPLEANSKIVEYIKIINLCAPIVEHG